MHTTAYVTINLNGVRSNLRMLRSLCPDSRVMAMVAAEIPYELFTRVAPRVHREYVP